MAQIDLKAVISAEDRTKAGFESVSKGINSLEASAVSFLKKAAVGLTAGITAFTVSAVKSAGEMQMLRASFDVLTGSAEKGADVFKRLSKMGATTPFETKDLADATKTLLSFNIPLEDSLKYLKQLGDVSLGDRNKLRGLSLAFAQVQSTGRLMGQDLLQMINQGFNPLTVIAQKTGKSIKQLKEEMEKGAISADMVADAFKTATSEGGLFFNGMEKGAVTFEGRMSTLKDNIGIAARAMIGLSDTGEVVKGGLFDKVSQGVERLISWIAQNQDKLVEFGGKMIEFVTNAGKQLIDFLINAYNWFSNNKSFIELVVGAVGSLYLSLKTLETWQAATAVWTGIRAGLEGASVAAAGGLATGGTVGGLAGSVAAVTAAIVSPTGLAVAGVAGFALLYAELKKAKGAMDGFNESTKKIDVAKVTGVLNTGQKGALSSDGRGYLNRASGGQVTAGSAYMVGEVGPEMFVPNRNGSIIPNGKMGSTVSVNFYGNINNTSNASLDDIGSRIARQIQLAAQGI